MSVRDLRPEDIEQLRQMHARMGIDYAFPNLNSPLFVIRKVAEKADGTISAALVFKLRAEAMLLLEGSPAEKMLNMCELQREALAEAYKVGLDEVDAAVPSALGFDKRLAQLGWTAERDGWRVWTRKVEASPSCEAP